MSYDPHKHHRRSIRLKGYDYTRSGAYFVTVCTNRRQCLFGAIQDGEMVASMAGEMVSACWSTLPERFPSIELDAFVLMPNHIHGILVITDRGLSGNNKSVTLGDVVGAFKSISTVGYIKGVKALGWDSFYRQLWQRNYYEHIIRNERALNAIRKYVTNNPAKWEDDQLHPQSQSNQYSQS